MHHVQVRVLVQLMIARDKMWKLWSREEAFSDTTLLERASSLILTKEMLDVLYLSCIAGGALIVTEKALGALIVTEKAGGSLDCDGKQH